MYRRHRYNLIRFDLSTADTTYKLFVKSINDYVIVKEVTVSDVTVRTYFIAYKNLETNWTNRASLTYSVDIQDKKLVNEGQNWFAAATGITFTGLLDLYKNAAAAYSLTRLSKDYKGAAIEVRRDSDNSVQDIGFVNGILDTAALTTFCSTPVTTYTSDFSTSEDLNEFSGNGTANESIGGVSEAYKFELTGGAVLHIVIFPAGTITENSTYDITFDYYIPSTNSFLDGIQLRTNAVVDGTFNQTVLDSWQTATINNLTVTGNALRIYALDGSSYTVNGDGDVFYLKNMVVTQNTSNGYVTKWYDQSGNGFDATQTTASAQPKIFDSVNGIILDNGKTAIEFDGVNDSLDVLSSTTIFKFLHDGTNSSIFALCNLISNDSNFAILNTNRRSSSNIGYAMQLDDRSSISRSMVLTSLISAGSAIQVSYNQSPNNFLTDSQQSLLIDLIDASNATAEDRSELYRDGGNAIKNNSLTNTASTNDASFDLEIFKNLGGKLQELIIYPNNQSSNRLPIENNINDRYQIYWSGATQRLLDTYTGATAAYSLEAINANYTGSIIQVRRDSDNAVLDIGANYDASLDVDKLENFCTTPVNRYTSDFSSTEDLAETNAIGSAANTIGGVSDAYKLETVAGGNGIHQARTFLAINQTFNISFDYYIPSTNSAVNEILVEFLNGDKANVGGVDSWQTANLTLQNGSGSTAILFRASQNNNVVLNVSGDVFYLKNIVITQLTSNGFVTIWYDQSGNSIDAINNVASEQPKIYDGINGIITEFGKPAISFDGTTQWLDANYSTSQFSQLFCVNNITDNTVVSFSGAVQLAFDRYNTSDDDVVFSANDGLFTIDNINVKGYRNSIDETGSATVFAQIFNRLYIGSTNGSSAFGEGTITEIIIYPFANDVSADRVAIEDNINDRYNIY